VDARKVLLGWLFYVAGTTAVYALVLNGRFGHDGELPMWLIAAVTAMALAAITFVLRWARAARTRRLPRNQLRDAAGFFWMIVLTGALGDMLAVTAEIAFGAAAVWLMIPIATITYTVCVVWLHRRYFNAEKVREN